MSLVDDLADMSWEDVRKLAERNIVKSKPKVKSAPKEVKKSVFTEAQREEIRDIIREERVPQSRGIVANIPPNFYMMDSLPRSTVEHSEPVVNITKAQKAEIIEEVEEYVEV